VSENRVLRIFGPKRDEVTGGWLKLHSEELHNLYSLLSIMRTVKLRRMRWTVHVARMGKKRNTCRLLVGKLEGKRALGIPRCTWVHNNKIEFRQMEWDDMDWIGQSQDRDK
jgi:hypothetical protein